MRKLLFVALVLVACKKKNVTPEPSPDPIPVCGTQDPLFSGVYRYTGGNYDTIEIIFLHNNCPTEKINTYVIKNLGKALQPMVKQGGNFPIKDYTVTVNDNNFSTNIETSPVFRLTRGFNNGLSVSGSEFVASNEVFAKIK